MNSISCWWKSTPFTFHGHRAELYAARVAKCLAGVEGREKVELVIRPRSNINENPPEPHNQQAPPPPPPQQNQDSQEDQKDEEEKEDEDDKEDENEQDRIREEFIFDAEGGLINEKLLFFAQQARRC
uniref:Uncharacterized protein n=1 Tax=Kalanchoe fedtschenkoi TaxID=63787 RepID=A0A7N0TA72_KALFE